MLDGQGGSDIYLLCGLDAASDIEGECATDGGFDGTGTIVVTVDDNGNAWDNENRIVVEGGPTADQILVTDGRDLLRRRLRRRRRRR